MTIRIEGQGKMQRAKKVVIVGPIALLVMVALVIAALLIVLNRPQKSEIITNVDTSAAAIDAVKEASSILPEGFTEITPLPGTYSVGIQLPVKSYSIDVPSEATVLYLANDNAQTINNVALLQDSQDVFTNNGFTPNGSGDTWAQYSNQSVMCRVDIQIEARAAATYSCASTEVINKEYATAEDLLNLQTVLPTAEVSAVHLRIHEIDGVSGALLTAVYAPDGDTPPAGYQLFYGKQNGNSWQYIAGDEIKETEDGKSGSTEALRTQLSDPQWNGVLLDLAGAAV